MAAIPCLPCFLFFPAFPVMSKKCKVICFYQTHLLRLQVKRRDHAHFINRRLLVEVANALARSRCWLSKSRSEPDHSLSIYGNEQRKTNHVNVVIQLYPLWSGSCPQNLLIPPFSHTICFEKRKRRQLLKMRHGGLGVIAQTMIPWNQYH